MPFVTPPAVFGDRDMLLYHLTNGDAKFFYREEFYNWVSCLKDSYTDKAIQSYISVGFTDPNYPLWGRVTDRNNAYFNIVAVAYGTEDHLLAKMVAGSLTYLAVESVDIGYRDIRSMKLSCSGTTIKSYRADLATPKLTATDTSFSSGYFGVGCNSQDYRRFLSTECFVYAKVVSASSPSPRSIAYFETPITGDGSHEEPFRAIMPKLIKNGVNLLALTHSSLIKSLPSGKPKEYRAIVRILEQPERASELKGIPECLDALRALRGVRELSLDEAKREAKLLDDKLTDEDLKEW